METKPTRKPPTKWHAVAVVLHASSCAAAAMCRSQRFLAKDAPRLPMMGCEHPDDCKCTYRHFADRRLGARRSNELGVVGANVPKRERRAAKGRRANDKR